MDIINIHDPYCNIDFSTMEEYDAHKKELTGEHVTRRINWTVEQNREKWAKEDEQAFKEWEEWERHPEKPMPKEKVKPKELKPVENTAKVPSIKKSEKILPSVTTTQKALFSFAKK